MPTVTFDLVQSIAITLTVLGLGELAKRSIPSIRRFAIPGPVLGGFAFAILVLILRETHLATIEFDDALQTPAMLAFFTTIGLAASLGLIKVGGRLLVVYLVFCWSIAIVQNLIGVGLAHLLGIDPLLGIMAGAVSMEGGHGGAAAFGPTAEEMGVNGATAVAIAAATFGLIAGSMTGGPLATWLIARHKLELKAGDVTQEEQELLAKSKAAPPISATRLMVLSAVIAVIMAIGTLLGETISDALGFAIPGYIGAMLVALVVRNVADAVGASPFHPTETALIGEIALGFFLTQAMMGLRIWDLYSLALPILVILAVQVLFLLAFAAFVVFPLLGKNYDAAVICGGIMGHGLGATPNAIANMDAICQRYGVRSNLAFVIVPLSGAMLIDIVALPWIVFSMNVF